ncbi:MAG: Ig-like domain-containing protein [Deltaproteobacteria bacterium]|nr:Ig-like domain-containing protein [Deltaproteobacteria bacterium]
MGCYSTSLNINGPTQIKNLSIDNKGISPNNDGFFDKTNITYATDEYASITSKLYSLPDKESDQLPAGPPLSLLLSGVQHSGGTSGFSWAGIGPSPTIVDDGTYAITVEGTDTCNNTTEQWIKVEVDHTPPLVLVSSPQEGEVPGNIVEIVGTVTDVNLTSYSVLAGEGEEPSSWINVSSGAKPETNGVLGRWDSYGLEGIWTIKVVAKDRYENKSEKRVKLNLDGRANIVKRFDTTQVFLSPNEDHQFDTLDMMYELKEIADVHINIYDSSGSLRKTFQNISGSVGVHYLKWYGDDSSGVSVGDGSYTIILKAELLTDRNITQSEKITAFVDTTAPTIEIIQPESNTFFSNDISVVGTVGDLNLSEYRVYYTGASGDIPVESGESSIINHEFGILKKLDEGNYILTVFARDHAGNVSEIKRSFIVDRTKPEIAFINPVEGESFGLEKNTINISAVISENNIESYILRYGSGANPSQWVELTSGTTLPQSQNLYNWLISGNNDLSDGRYTLSLYAKDKAGLENDISVGIFVDNSPPNVSILSPQDGNYVKGPIDIKGSAFDENLDKYTLEYAPGHCNAAFSWKYLKSDSSSISDDLLFSWNTLPSNGEYCIRLTAGDMAGNIQENKVNIKIDTEPPASPIMSANLINADAVQLSWTENVEPDLAGYNIYRNDDLINSEIITDISFLDENIIDGTYIYGIKAVDHAGWESELSNTAQFEINWEGPKAKIVFPSDNAFVKELVEIKGTAYSASDFSQYRIFIGSGTSPSTWNMLRSSPLPVPYGVLMEWDTSGYSDGVYTLKLETEDIIGNIDDSFVRVTVDNTPPSTPELIHANVYDADIALLWSKLSDGDLEGYLIYRNDQLFNAADDSTENITPYIIKSYCYYWGCDTWDEDLNDGSYSYYVIAVDQAGNLSVKSNVISASVDNNEPHMTIVQPVDGSVIHAKTTIRSETPDEDILNVLYQYKGVNDQNWISLGAPVDAFPYDLEFDPESITLQSGDYNLRAVATDTSLKVDSSPSFITFTYIDQTPPAIPQGLNASVDGVDILITWTANNETDLGGYNLYKVVNGSRIRVNSSVITENSYLLVDVADGQHSYALSSVDNYANESDISEIVDALIYQPILERFSPFTTDGSAHVSGWNAASLASLEISVLNESGEVLTSNIFANITGSFVADLSLLPGENAVTVVATDNSGNKSRVSKPVTIIFDDPPAVPTGLAATVLDYDVSLSWNANVEPDIAKYYVYRNEKLIGSSGSTGNYDPLEITSVSASSTSSGGWWSSFIYKPEYAVDTNPDTYWSPDLGFWGFDISHWFQINLGSTDLVSRMEVDWGNSYGIVKIEIQVLKNGEWLTVSTLTGDQAIKSTYDFEQPYLTGNIRINILGQLFQPLNVNVHEITAYKESASGEVPTYYEDIALIDGVYNYSIVAFDNYGLTSPHSETLSVTVGDIVAPLPPTGLSVIASGSSAVLSWFANSEPDIAGYRVYRNSEAGWLALVEGLVTDTAYTDNALSNGNYSYRIIAVDHAGNESDFSNEASVEINSPPPAPPVIISVSAVEEGSALIISWEPVDLIDGGYNVYRRLESGVQYVKLNSTLLAELSYLDSGLVNGTGYYYVVSAEDSIGNESSYSNEVRGTPSDDIAAKPIILLPTTAASPLVVTDDRTDISGQAEIGATIELYKNGVYERSTVANDQSINRNLTDYPGSISLSPDGNTLVYETSDSLRILDLESGVDSLLAERGISPAWSPDGKKVAYIQKYIVNNYYRYRLAIYDRKRNEISNITDGSYYYEYDPLWSPDSRKIIFTRATSNSSQYTNIWIKDLPSNSLSQITFDGRMSFSKFSPDGNNISYIYDNDNLYVAGLSGENPILIGTNIDDYSYSWSPDSSRLLFYADWKTYTVDMSTYEWTELPINGANTNFLTWSPDGERIIYATIEGSYRRPMWIMPLNGGEAELFKGDVYYLDNLYWSKLSGALVYTEDTTFFRTYPDGHFSFNDVTLDVGDNSFYSIAVDAAGNRSNSSDSISVLLDVGLLPDLVTTVEDISYYPDAPVDGEQISVMVDIWNKGGSDAFNVDADIYMWDSSGSLELIKSAVIPHIPPHSSVNITADWSAVGKEGINGIITVLDPDNKVTESDETNNFESKEIIVSKDDGISIYTVLDSNEYVKNENVNITVNLANSGEAAEGLFEVRINDVYGFEVTTFGTLSLNLESGVSQFNYSWNTGSIYPGTYHVQVIFKGSSGLIEESTVPFAVLPDIQVETLVGTNQATYGPNSNVNIGIDVNNMSENYLVSTLTLKTIVKNSSGAKLLSENSDLYNILPGSNLTLSLGWNTALHEPGGYTVEVVTYMDGALLSLETASFEISSSFIVSGDIGLAHSSLMAGNLISADYTVRNFGNTGNDGTVRISIADPVTGTALLQAEENASLAVNGSQSGTMIFPSQDLDLKTHTVRLVYLSSGIENYLADSSLSIIDGMPPAVSVISPREGIEYNGSVEISAIVTDDKSGVHKVEYRVDNGAWYALSTGDVTAGRYMALWEPSLQDGGEHTVTVKASDRSGNMSSPVPVIFTVQTDSTPPVTEVIPGTPLFVANNMTYLSGGTTFTLSATDTESGVAAIQYRTDGGNWIDYVVPFTMAGAAEGGHVMGYRSIDKAGNVEAEKSLTFVIDNSAPVSVIAAGAPQFSSPDGSFFVTPASQFTLTAQDSHSGVSVSQFRIDGGPWIDYTPFTVSSEGVHLIEYRSLDNLGNVEEIRSLAVITDAMPPLSTAEVSLPQYTDGAGRLFVRADTKVTLSAADDLSGVASTSYSIDGGTPLPYGVFTVAAEGEHVVSYSAVDNVNNAEMAQHLSFTVDNSAPVSELTVTGAQHVSGGISYVRQDSVFNISASDNLAGVSLTEYRVDGGNWAAYAPFTIAAEGSHLIEYRSADNVGNMEAVKALSVITDNTPPLTSISVGNPKFDDGRGNFYVTASTEYTLTATDKLSGAASTEYRIDGGPWTAYAPFTIAAEGSHLIEYRSADNVGNMEGVKSLFVIVDNTPPETAITFSDQVFGDGQTIYITGRTEVALSATDNLSGVKETYYLFDGQAVPQKYSGPFQLDALGYGSHVIRYYSMDKVDNAEAEKRITVVVIGVDMTTEILNLPRVLVWTEDPSKGKSDDDSHDDGEKEKGKKKDDDDHEDHDDKHHRYSLEDMRTFIEDALGSPHVYYTVVTDKEAFRKEFRSGIYNMVMVLDNKKPLDEKMLREMKEGVYRGMGLLVSGWGNSVNHELDDLFGVKFKGSLSDEEDKHSLHLYESPLSSEQNLTVSGRVLKTELKGGSLAGIIPGEEECEGVRSITLSYARELAIGDRVIATLSVKDEEEMRIIDEEFIAIEKLPGGVTNDSRGNTDGDLVISEVTAEGVIITLTSPYEYLEEHYHLTLVIEGQGGDSESIGPVRISPDCDSHLQAGVEVGALRVLSVDKEREKEEADVPTLILNSYGQGRAALFTYNMTASALGGDNRAEQAELLGKASAYLLAHEALPAAGSVVLLGNRIKLHGGGMEMKAVETPGEGLAPLPLFGLTPDPLEYSFYLEGGGEKVYRYFVRVDDEEGDYTKKTDVYINSGSGYDFFESYPYHFSVSDDSESLLQQSQRWVEAHILLYPGDGHSDDDDDDGRKDEDKDKDDGEGDDDEDDNDLAAMGDMLSEIALMPKGTSSEIEKVIKKTVHVLHKTEKLSFDASGLRTLLARYLRIMEGEWYFSSRSESHDDDDEGEDHDHREEVDRD